MVNPKRTEPLITKAYDAFRRQKSSNAYDKGRLITTDCYLDE